MAHIPSKADVLQWISDNPSLTSKRDIAKAFGIKGAARIDLKRLLKDLEAEGHLTKRKKTYRDPDSLPPVCVVKVTGTDADGDLFAAPMDWQGEGPEPRLLFVPKDGDPALGPGDRILVRLTVVQGEDHSHEARLIRRIGTGPRRILGVFRTGAEGGRILPIDKKADREWRVSPGATGGAKDGELVEAEQTGPKGRMGLPAARIVDRLGDPSGPRAVSLIAIHQHGIPDSFPDDVIAEAEASAPVESPDGREDLTHLPLVTIDPADARDHDDACWAHPDDDPTNKDGYVIWVAIADVAHYVRPGSKLEKEALKRGNSTYFPDRVVPMLPDHLSGDLCSLHEDVTRPCIAARMQVDADGALVNASFHRGVMRSRASLVYEEVQVAMDGTVTDRTAPFLEEVIRPLYAAYDALKRARAKRQPLELDLPERQIVLTDAGQVDSVAFKDRLEAHKLIEEFMVLANVAAAKTLEAKRTDLLYRVHEEPEAEKLDALRETAQASGFALPKGQVLQTRQLNRLLSEADGTEFQELINLTTLRSMMQAYYSPRNFGHFGLALRSYAHFTSPIRRYADLVVHRALIKAHGWGDDGQTDTEVEQLEQIAEAISQTERRSMVAERDTTDRYLAAFLADKVGATFTGRISGVQSFGFFVKLDETGADGIEPIRSVGAEYFRYDREAQTLEGTETGTVIGPGQEVVVKLAEAAPVTGGLVLELLEIAGDPVARPKRHNRKPRGKGKVGKKRGKPKLRRKR